MSRTLRRRAAPRRTTADPRSRRGSRTAPDWARIGTSPDHGEHGRRNGRPARSPGRAREGGAFIEDDEDVEVVPTPASGSLAEASLALAAERSAWVDRLALPAWLTVVLLGAAALLAAIGGVGPGWLDGAGATAVVTAYAAALAARTGGRPVAFGALGLVLGVAVLAVDQDIPRTGAAVLTGVVSAVLAVMVTRPAVRLRAAALESALALAVAGLGALAVVGFAPVIAVERFEYVVLGLAAAGTLALVHRLGAGRHGLDRRGTALVLLGVVVLAATVLYAELLRSYGPPGVVDHLLDGVRWSRRHLGAFPRPLETVLGVPALAWGCHMRARRRQGWWLCAFGVAATAPVASSLVNPAVSLLECVLSVVYGLVVGLLVAVVAIRIDLAVTGSRDRGARRREESRAVRPEPPRTEALM